MEPTNYLSQVADPFVQAAQGLQLGAGMVELQQKQALMAQQQRQQQLLAQEQALFLKNLKPTMRDAARYASFLSPDQATAFLPYMQGISKEQQQNTLKSVGQILSALQFNPPTGIQNLKDYATAQRNGGDEAEAELYDRLAEAAADQKRGPAVAFKSLVTIASPIPGAKEMFESIDKASTTARAEALFPSELRQAQIKAQDAMADLRIKLQNEPNNARKLELETEIKELERQQAEIKAKYAEREAAAELKAKAATLGLTTAQTNQALATTSKLSKETAKIVLEVAALEASGGVDPDKKFQQEEKLRKEYQDRTKVYNQLGFTYSNIEESAKAKTGPGDIALITGFMKMIDPGAIVRETDFALARDTAGLFDRLANQAQKLKSGELFTLDSKQRQEYVSLAKQYLDAAQAKAIDDKKALGIVVKNYKLNPENVFGQEPPPLPTSAIVNGVTYQRPASFTDTQWRNYLKDQGVMQ
jgi:hypothetical protein